MNSNLSKVLATALLTGMIASSVSFAEEATKTEQPNPTASASPKPTKAKGKEHKNKNACKGADGCGQMDGKKSE